MDKVGELGANVFYLSGCARLRSGKYREALDDFNKGIESNPNSGAFHQMCGTCYFCLEEYSKCVADLTQSIKLGQNTALSYYLRGRAYFELKEYSKSGADLAESLRIDQNNANAHLVLGMLYLRSNDGDKAIESAKRAVELNPLVETEGADIPYSCGICSEEGPAERNQSV